jgi:hypothetical protein
VLSMALVMLANGDPDASAGLATGFAFFTAALFALLVAWYRPLFAGPGEPDRRFDPSTASEAESCARGDLAGSAGARRS